MNSTVIRSSATGPARTISLDQFRGYSVAAMFIVNFVGGLAVTHHFFRHNNTHFSYADSIMPSFLMICGLTYRMSFLKRASQLGTGAASGSIVRRSLGLIGLSLILTAFNSQFASWQEMSGVAMLDWLAKLIKANMWEVLAIIGAAQIVILPVIGRSFGTRLLTVILFGVMHLLLSWSFNFEFVYGRPNWFDNYFGATGKRAWDGGLFGLLSWSEIMLVGTLAYDVSQNRSPGRTASWLFFVGTLLMLSGYAFSCLTRLYDAPLDADISQRAALMDDEGFAHQPVLPEWTRLENRSWTEMLAEAPFVPPPPSQQRAINYWRMDKRVVTQSFVLFSSGFALALYGLFVIVCDGHGLSLGLFRTFGQNPLAAYIIHHLVAVAFWTIVPKDSPLWAVILGLIAYFSITYLFVRYLEQRQLYLRL